MSAGTWGPAPLEETEKVRAALAKIIGEEGMRLVERLIEIAIENYDYTDPDDRR